MSQSKEVVFVDVETLSEGFSEFSLPQTTDLVGKEIVLHYEEDYTVTLNFLDDQTLRAVYQKGDEIESVGANYLAVSPKKDVYFVDFIWSVGFTKSITTVLDLGDQIATTSIGILPTLAEADISNYRRYTDNLPLSSVKAIFHHAAINRPFTPATKKHKKTSRLVGERIQFKYSNNDVYEHVYLNENFYTWHCLKGVEAGLCDTDACHYYDLGHNLVWFVWREKIVPTLGSVIEDFDAMRSFGKLYGYKNSIQEETIINFSAGSYAKMLNSTKYDFD